MSDIKLTIDKPKNMREFEIKLRKLCGEYNYKFTIKDNRNKLSISLRPQNSLIVGLSSYDNLLYGIYDITKYCI
jgi:hypothetical protein